VDENNGLCFQTWYFSHDDLLSLEQISVINQRCPTLHLSGGARSAFNRERLTLVEKHAIGPSTARLCYAALG
jgi:hypothetical protein